MPRDEQASLNTGELWSDLDMLDLRWCAENNCSSVETADFLCRSLDEVKQKAACVDLSFVDMRH
ncbi:MAG TPA: hypothetical protein VFB45_26605 [Pseudolabrys sp.]|nr:hypothetical protein [Pseudolabrys sp.]